MEGGAGDGATIEENERQWLAIIPQMLRDISRIDSSTIILGIPASFPVLVAPTAGQFLFDTGAEEAAATGTKKAGVPFVRSFQADRSMSEVSNAQSHWMQQLYLPRDRERALPHLAAARECGAVAIVLTVDQISTPTQHRFRSQVSFDRSSGSTEALAAGVTFDDLRWMVEAASLPVIAKRILHPDDAIAAVDAGAAAVVVSNHGGRQIEGSITPAEVLAEVVDAIGDRLPVLADSEIRTESDIFRARALGATAALIGRPVVRALWEGGSSTVGRYLNDLYASFDTLLALAGTASVSEITRAAVRLRA